MSVLVRKMKGADITDWIIMRRQLWDDISDTNHRKEMGDLLSSNTSCAYIALGENDDLAGFAEVSIRDYANGCTHQPVPFLEGIWVSSDHRRQGVGGMLIEAITAEMRSQGYKELCSDADDQNLDSHRAHEDWGFEETERVIYFRKPLT
ncbi:MAG: GNAT family N-acetyltransferase [Rhizobiaceae bacterium]